MDDHPRCRGVGSARVLGAGGPTTVYRDNGVDGYRVYRRLEDVETHLIAEVTPGAGSSRKLLSSSTWISAALAMVVPKSSAKTITLSVVSSANSLQRQRLDGLRPTRRCTVSRSLWNRHTCSAMTSPTRCISGTSDERSRADATPLPAGCSAMKGADLLSDDGLVTGPVLDARTHLLEAPTMWDRAEAVLREDPFAFVSRA